MDFAHQMTFRAAGNRTVGVCLRAALLVAVALPFAGCRGLSRGGSGDLGADVPAEDSAGASSAGAVSLGAVVEVRGQDQGGLPPSRIVPRELQKISLQPYVLEPPDIVLIDVVRAVPKSPYTIESLDALQIVVDGTLEGQPIAGIYAVDPGGFVQLGPAYGGVKLKGLSLVEAREAIEKQLRASIVDPRVSISLAQIAGQQQIVGEHLVGLDGTLNLGSYGSVYVTGMTLVEARAAIEAHLGEFLEAPKISLDVFAYNSKKYYVIVEGAGQGDRVTPLPITGNETVLDAIGTVGGLTALSSKTIWIARPAPAGVDCDQILPVNWREITRGGSTATNFQILPGDRLFISEDRFVAIDSTLEKMLRPFERLLGFTALGAQSVQQLQRFPKGFNQGGF
ncbi:MAG: polysaccharide biosynthesis/export family protein [Pirellulales bacterium]